MSHSERKKVIQRMLVQYFTKWWNDLGDKYAKNLGSIHITIRAESEMVDRCYKGKIREKDISIAWDARFVCYVPEEVESKLPLKD